MQRRAESTLNKLTMFKSLMETQHPLQSLAEIRARIRVTSATLESNAPLFAVHESNASYGLALH